MSNENNRGQVGIGTLIVFIAMVLVAAIAAGVLINTAGLLQAQAQQTGEETTAEVSDVIQVGEVIGFEDGSLPNSTNLSKINASLRLASGSDPINVSQVSYTVSSPSGSATVINGDNTTNSDVISHFQKQGMEPEDGSVLKDQEDLLISQIDLKEASNVDGLEESERVKLIVQAPAGGQTYAELKAPRNIEEGESYIL